jgi:thymidine kinase
MFEPIRRAIECAFNIKTLDMSCDHCANDATHHLRYVNDELIVDGEPVAVEDDNFKRREERYESVCFSCYTRAIDVAEMRAIEKQAEQERDEIIDRYVKMYLEQLEQMK